MSLRATQPEIAIHLIQIDSFINHSNYQRPLEIIDSLLMEVNKLKSEERKLDSRLSLLLRQTLIQERIEEDKKALKTLLQVEKMALDNDLFEMACQANLQLALIYEKNNDTEYCQKSLNKALNLCKKYNLGHLFGRYYVRKSSFYRVTSRPDSSLIFAHKALELAQKYENPNDLMDSYLLLGLLYASSNYEKAIEYQLLTINEYLKRDDLNKVSLTYHNMARLSISQNDIESAFRFNDSGFVYLERIQAHNLTDILKYKSPLLEQRAELFEKTGQSDSAVVYLRAYFEGQLDQMKKDKSAEVKKITEQYENDKKESIIRSKNVWITFYICMIAIIACLAVALYLQNRKIRLQNITINQQVDDLKKNLELKQVLLSELQHRVKNNLQHVISILEIQKESINFNNIDESIRENINRIQSMALLHQRLSVHEDVSEINMGRYMEELGTWVKQSYGDLNRNVTVLSHCTIQHVRLETALPLGLILVELISNSIKHAFNPQNNGLIEISLDTDKTNGKRKLSYSDSGKGFNFDMIDPKGLGLEIIKGLIDQLSGITEINTEKGFAISITF